MVTVECVILDVCPPYLETSQFIRSLLRRHISSVCARFPSYCSVMTSRCASRGLLQPKKNKHLIKKTQIPVSLIQKPSHELPCALSKRDFMISKRIVYVESSTHATISSSQQQQVDSLHTHFSF